jgi:hypothetical protein
MKTSCYQVKLSSQFQDQLTALKRTHEQVRTHSSFSPALPSTLRLCVSSHTHTLMQKLAHSIPSLTPSHTCIHPNSLTQTHTHTKHTHLLFLLFTLSSFTFLPLSFLSLSPLHSLPFPFFSLYTVTHLFSLSLHCLFCRNSRLPYVRTYAFNA